MLELNVTDNLLDERAENVLGQTGGDVVVLIDRQTKYSQKFVFG